MSEAQNQSPSDTQNKIGGENSLKTMNRENEPESNSPGQFQGQGSNGKEASIDNLLPEMLREILQYLDTRTLFTLRLVNQNFNSVSSRVLCHRPDAQISVEFVETVTIENRFTVLSKCSLKEEHFRIGEKSLMDFLSCMKKCKNVPYAHFAFSVLFYEGPSALFDHPHFQQLLSHFSSSSQKCQNSDPNPDRRINGLDLKFCEMNSDTFEILAAKLGDLLLNKTPFMENLSLDFERSNSSPQAKLFPSPSKNEKQGEINLDQLSLSLPIEPEPKFQLPHLKTIRFKSPRISNDSGILQDLFAAAVNLKKLYLDPDFDFDYPIETFEFLQSLGKLHLLKNFVNCFISDSTLPKFSPDFTRALFSLQLEELEVATNQNYLSSSKYPQAESFISRLFESNKNSLKKLSIMHLGSLSALQFPTFTSLTELKLEGATEANTRFFTTGVRALDIFPAVRHLDLPQNWTCGFGPLEFIPVFPSVENLSVDDTGFTSNCVSTLDLLCPNLKHLKIHRNDCSDGSEPQLIFLPVGREIWRLMTGLESLEIDICVDSSFRNNSAELDSCFTGISVENWKRLFKMRDSYSDSDSESESQLTVKREHPSILNMKSLKKLTVNRYSAGCRGWTKIDSTRSYRNKWTWISQEFAFNLMPNLKVN